MSLLVDSSGDQAFSVFDLQALTSMKVNKAKLKGCLGPEDFAKKFAKETIEAAKTVFDRASVTQAEAFIVSGWGLETRSSIVLSRLKALSDAEVDGQALFHAFFWTSLQEAAAASAEKLSNASVSSSSTAR